MSATRPRRRVGNAAGLALAVVLFSALTPLSGARAAHGGLALLGDLPDPRSGPRPASQWCSIVQLDPTNRRLYSLCASPLFPKAYLTEYDLGPRIPQPLRTVASLPSADIPGALSPYDAVLDHARHRLLLLATNEAGQSVVHVIDLRSLKETKSWSVTNAVPGFAALGMSYSPQDDRVYLVGDMSGSSALASGVLGSKVVGPMTSVVALRGKNGRLAWIRPVPQCQQALFTLGTGSLIARSAFRPSLYFFCSTGGTINVNPYPGEAGLVRVNIAPATTSEWKALHFPVEFFPISGSYTNGNQTGIAAFDPGSDRFFAQSLADSNPGAWVFDGRLSAWVGFVAAPNANDFFLGLDPSTGHYYMAGVPTGNQGWLLVSDARLTPVPQGNVYRFAPGQTFITTDPRTHRLFLQLNVGSAVHPKLQYVVLKDETPEAPRPKPIDYDSQTMNVPEGKNTITTFAGDVDGYGVKLQSVGGLSFGTGINPPGLAQGDRGLIGSRVSSVDLRAVGASASAQAGVPDTATETDRGGVQEQVQAGPAAPAANSLNWPWSAAACLDSGGGAQPAKGTGPGGSAMARCDLAKEVADASSALGAFAVRFKGGKVSLGSSSFATTARRDARYGVVTATRSEASGFEMSLKGAGALSISRTVATTETAARGRPGTTFARWSRLLEGIVVRNASGKIVYERSRCTTTVSNVAHHLRSSRSGDCGGMTKAIDDALQTRMRVDLPRPQVTATPKGAFAGVQQTPADYFQDQTVNHQGVAFLSDSLGQEAVPALQVAVFNDGASQSRLVVQLAAIQASSIYTISLPSAGGGLFGILTSPAKGGSSGGGRSGTGGVTPGRSGGLGTRRSYARPAPIAPVTTAGSRAGVGTVVGVLIRSPKDALLTAGVWVLFLVAGLSVARRRNLIDVLQGRRK